MVSTGQGSGNSGSGFKNLVALHTSEFSYQVFIMGGRTDEVGQGCYYSGSV